MKEFNFRELPTKVVEDGCGLPLLAKSPEYGGISLHRHLFEAGCAALTVADLSSIDLDEQLLRISCFTAGLFHDIGKAANGFQAMLQKKEIKRWPKDTGGFRHEILSAAIFYHNCSELPKWKSEPNWFRAVFFSVLTHHKAFKILGKSDKRRLPYSQFFGKPQFKQMYLQLMCTRDDLRKEWERLIATIIEDKWGKNLIEEGWLPLTIEIPDYNAIKTKFKKINSLLPGYRDGIVHPDKLINKDGRKILTAVRAFLITGDHLSSGSIFNIVTIPDFSQYSVIKFEPYAYQKLAQKSKGNTILIAPTGSGKTEASLLWVSNNQKFGKKDGKVFYVLPFSASINAMAERFNKVLGTKSGLVAIQHAKAADVFYSIIEGEISNVNKNKRNIIHQFIDPWKDLRIKSSYVPDFSEMIYHSTRQRFFKGKTGKIHSAAARHLAKLSQEVFYPVKVTTPHQLLKGLLQGRGWESVISEFHGAAFIFDEIHSYAPNIVGLIFGLIKTLIEEFHARVLVMSATFPSFLLKKLQDTINDSFQTIIRPDPIADKVILDKKRHLIEVVDTPLLEFLSTFDFDLSTQYIIFCNTVGTAQEAYRILCTKMDESLVLLFHSRFKQGDRNEIEKLVKDHLSQEFRVLVATQVVEVSLDIDFAIGISEVAPMDALIQRFGRINRKGKRQLLSTNIYLTREESPSKFIYRNDILSSTFELLSQLQSQKLSEIDLVRLVDELYTLHGWNDEEEARFERAFNLASSEFYNQCIPGAHKRWIDKIIDADSSVEVLLEEDVRMYKKLSNSNPLSASKFLVKIRKPRWIVLNTEDDKLPPILNKNYYRYESTIGLTLVRPE